MDETIEDTSLEEPSATAATDEPAPAAEEPAPAAEPEPEPEPDEHEEPAFGAYDDDDDDGQAEARILSEQALEKRSRQLDGEKARHAKRLGEIFGDDAADLIPCPVCMDGIDGWIYPPEIEQLSPEAIARVRQVIGLPDYTTFKQAKFAEACPDCGGLGEVVTGSHVPGSEVATCETCQKRGWVRTMDIPRVQATDNPAGAEVTGPTVYVADEADTEVRNLRQRGYTVIPPMREVIGS